MESLGFLDVFIEVCACFLCIYAYMCMCALVCAGAFTHVQYGGGITFGHRSL